MTDPIPKINFLTSSFNSLPESRKKVGSGNGRGFFGHSINRECDKFQRLGRMLRKSDVGGIFLPYLTKILFG